MYVQLYSEMTLKKKVGDTELVWGGPLYLYLIVLFYFFSSLPLLPAFSGTQHRLTLPNLTDGKEKKN